VSAAPESTVAGADFVIERSASGRTSRVAEAATALLPAFVVSAPTGIVLTWAAPGVLEVTSIENAHELLPATVPPVSVTLPEVLVTVPPLHELTMFGVPATVRPEGNVSATEVTVIAEALPFVMVIVSVEVPPGLIVAGEKAFVIDGAVAVTVSAAVFDAGPVGAWALDRPEVVLLSVPATVPRTTTVTVHESDAGTVSPLNVSAACPAVKLLPPAPAHVPPPAPVASITMPAGIVSVKPALVSVIGFGLVSVKVTVLVPPIATVAGENALLIDGTLEVEIEAEAAVPAAASLLVAVLVVLVTLAVVVTLCVIVQVAPAGMVPALKPTLVPPFTPPVSVALPDEHDTPPAALLVSPAGYVSEIATPVRLAGFAAGFVTVIVIVELPPVGMNVGANAFVTVGAVKTRSVPLAAEPVPAFVVVMAPVELVYAPAVFDVTFTVIVHELLAGIVPEESATLVPPAPADTVPEHPAPEIAPDGDAVLASPAG
jgi:hypothetical protein